MPKVAVVIVNYNAGARLERCLGCLEAQSFRDFQTIVIDNASTDGSLAFARASRLGVRVIEAGSNLGFAVANNRAAAVADAEWLAFLNPDAYAEPDWLEELLAGAARHPWAEAFGSTQIDAKDESLLDGVGDVFSIYAIPYRGGHGWPISATPAEDGECFSPCAAAAMYRKRTFDALGGFDESFFCYGEDVDLGFRLRLSGGRAVQLARARVAHEGSAVTGRRSDFTVYHGHRNRIWLAYKNTPAILYWPTTPLRVAADLYLFVRSFFFGVGPAFARALVDGYGGLGGVAARRRAAQAGRTASLAEIMRMIDWSPARVMRRAPALRPIPPPDRA